MKYHFLYETKNLNNNKIYVGVHSTDRLDDGYLGSGVAFRNALKKHGKKSFRRKILKFFYTQQAAYAEEFRIIDEAFINDDKNYNIKIGGEGTVRGRLNVNYGKKLSKERVDRNIEHTKSLNPLRSDAALIETIQKAIDDKIFIKDLAKILNEKGIKNRWGNEWDEGGQSLSWNIRQFQKEGLIKRDGRLFSMQKGMSWEKERVEKRIKTIKENHPMNSAEAIAIIQDCLNKDLPNKEIVEKLADEGILNTNGNIIDRNTFSKNLNYLISNKIVKKVKASKVCPECNKTFYRKKSRSVFKNQKYCSTTCVNSLFKRMAKESNSDAVKKGWITRKQNASAF